MTDVFATLEATWPAAAKQIAGPWEIKEGKGGGKRVTAAKQLGPVTAQDVVQAEDAMDRLGQKWLFVLQPDNAKTDSILAERGYQIVDPTLLYVGPLPSDTIPPVTTFDIWPPLQIMRDIWLTDGVGPDRLAVMHRVIGPKTSILGRIKDRAAGALFVAIHERMAMVHAVVVAEEFRRNGLAAHMMQAASDWARMQGADQMSLAVTDANTAAKSLYTSLGMTCIGRYHYRIKP